MQRAAALLVVGGLGVWLSPSACALSQEAEPAAESALGPADFAYGREIRLPADPPALLRVELPREVYRSLQSRELGDLVVFNGRGVQVPHAVRALQPAALAEPRLMTLPVFPLRQARPKEQVDLLLEVDRDADGKVVRIATRASAPGASTRRIEPTGPVPPPSAAPPVSAYLLDARELPRPVVALVLALANGADDLVLPISVESSPDLVRWNELPVRGALVSLGHQGHRIEQDRLELEQPADSAFYRLTHGRGGAFPHELLSVAATLAVEPQARPLERVEVRGRALKPELFRFDLGGSVPVDRVELVLPDSNTILNAELRAASRPDGPWSAVASLKPYRIGWQGEELRGPVLDLARRHDRYYELAVQASGGGLGTTAPLLVTHHTPDQLLFLRRGDGPFTLAYGRYQAAASRFEAEDLLALLPGQGAAPALATLGEAKTLGGPARLAAPQAPPPYKTYALWAVLIAGVILLAKLALQLARAPGSRS